MTTPDHPQPLASDSSATSPQEERARLRERMLRRFEVWLDEALDPEAVPQGLAAEILDQLESEDLSAPGAGCSDDDLQSVCAALVGLTDAGRQQGEALLKIKDAMPAVQGLTDAVSDLLKTVAADQEKQAQTREKQQQELAVQARRDIFKEVLDAVITMRDRLAEQLAAAEAQVVAPVALAPAPKRRWWQLRASARPAPAPVDSGMRTAVEALVKGCQLALQQVDESLNRWHVQAIACEGKAFDAEQMKAVDQEERDDVADGTVVQVLRAGYTWNKTLLRQAEVKVARSAAPAAESATS